MSSAIKKIFHSALGKLGYRLVRIEGCTAHQEKNVWQCASNYRDLRPRPEYAAVEIRELPKKKT